ncbi:MAG: Na/Pi cotransporter family protein [Desulfurellaceae bacterium]|nr:Na/Pi cotransporter family protein [Desulfurellaceae bacterium]
MAEPLSAPEVRDEPTARQGHTFLRWVGVALLVYGLIIAVGLIEAGFKSATGGQARELFAFATNPFLGLLVGTVATALIQSSSTVTSIIVGLVAGGMPVMSAVPMVMGANIGTTITNTLVSLGHVADKDAFRRAFAAATVHDCFNVLSVLIFLPVEIVFHPLEKIGQLCASLLAGGDSLSLTELNFVKAATQPVVAGLTQASYLLPHPFDGIGLIGLGVALIFVTISWIGRLLRLLMIGRARELVHLAIG